MKQFYTNLLHKLYPEYTVDAYYIFSLNTGMSVLNLGMIS